MKASKTLTTLSVVVVAGLALGALADRAEAQYFFTPAPVYAPPVYYAPVPVYVAPPPVYYAPPVYMAPRPMGYYPRGFGFSFGYESSRRSRYYRRPSRGFGFSFGFGR